jgi:hypothetical protein
MVGKVTTKGDRAVRAQVARRNFDLDGRGIKIGVISDSYNALRDAETDILSGDLPGRNNPFGYTKPVRVLKDLRGNDEGRAMLQIITDIAPGAELLFHTAYATPNRITERSFTNAVKALARAGADIIVDDVAFSTTIFQDGLAARTVDQVNKRGIAYFSAVGNDGNRSYDGIFRPSSQFTFRGNPYEAHNFAIDGTVDLFQDVSLAWGDVIAPMLGWDQPAGQITSDLELFLVGNPQLPEAGGKLLAVSTTLFSGGVEQPLEQLIYEARTNKTAYLVIARKVDAVNPTNQIKWVSTANSADSNVIYEYVNDGSDRSSNTIGEEPSTVYGQPNARGAIAVGSVQVNRTPLFGVKPPILDDFSSRGGTPILLDPQGRRLASPDIRQKPELVAPNGVATTFQPFNPFFGTSAAAPHAAAVAALILQRAGGAKRLTPAQILEIMQRTAIPIDPVGNFRSGAGLIQADAAVLEAFDRSVEGTNNRNRIQGQNRADNLRGFSGNDRLNGGGGFDALFGGAGRDRLRGDDGNDYLLGEVGQDTLVGGSGSDVLLGSRGADRLMGGKGDDLLAGGAGQNWLIGGKGRNLFVLSLEGVAIISDYRAGRDRIALADGLRFDQLQIKPQRNTTLIQFGDQRLARLIGVTTMLERGDFTTIALKD